MRSCADDGEVAPADSDLDGAPPTHLDTLLRVTTATLQPDEAERLAGDFAAVATRTGTYAA
jgi:hypothetical protein